jgi:hypothetical protein
MKRCSQISFISRVFFLPGSSVTRIVEEQWSSPSRHRVDRPGVARGLRTDDIIMAQAWRLAPN